MKIQANKYREKLEEEIPYHYSQGIKLFLISHTPKYLWDSPCLHVIMMTETFLSGMDTICVCNHHMYSHGSDESFCKPKSSFHWPLSCMKVRSWFVQTSMKEYHLFLLCCVSVSRVQLRLQTSWKRKPTVTKAQWSIRRLCRSKLSQEKTLAFSFFRFKASSTQQYQCIVTMVWLLGSLVIITSP